MRISIFLVLALLIAGCISNEDRAERDLERAEEKLERARERVEEASEKARDELREARHQLSEAYEKVEDVRDDWSEDTREEAGRALDDIGLDEALGSIFEEVGRALKGDDGVEPVEATELMKLLPDEIEGYRLHNTNRDNSGALGIRVAHVRGDYETRDGADMTIALVDLGTLHRVASTAREKLDLHIDREDRTRREWTTEFEGYPGHVKLSDSGRRQQIEGTVFVGERFVVHVQADGEDADEDLLERVLDRIGLRRLARLD